MNLRWLAQIAVASAVLSSACTGGAGGLEVDEGLALSGTTKFQDGVSPSASYRGTSDTILEENAPGSNFSSATTLLADRDSPDGSNKSADVLLKFNLSSIPTNATVSAASLTLNVTNATSGEGYEVYALLRGWTASQATWKQANGGTAWSAPGARGSSDRYGTVLGKLIPTQTGAYTLKLNATGVAAVQSWVKTPSTNNGFVIDSVTDKDGLRFSSSKVSSASARPALTVSYSVPAPVVPDAGSPAPHDAGTPAPIDAGTVYSVPSGKGIYAYQSLGVAGFDLQTAFSKVMAQAAKDGIAKPTLTLPKGTFEGAGFGQANVLTFNIPDNLSLIGSGPETVITIRPNSMTASNLAQYSTYATTGGNQYAILQSQHGTGMTFAQFSVVGTAQQNGSVYNGFAIRHEDQLTVRDLWVKSVPGSLNTPPGETYGLGLNSVTNATLTRVEVDGRDVSNNRVGAIGIALNGTTGTDLHDCYTHDTGWSAGLAMWRAQDVESWNFKALHTGRTFAESGSHGSQGAGINTEQTRNTKHHHPILGWNTLGNIRYYGSTDGSTYQGDTTPHELDGVQLEDGAGFLIHLGKAQTSHPSITNSPTPTYDVSPSF